MSTDTDTEKALKRITGERETVNEAIQVQPIELDQIEANRADNARKHVKPATVVALADDIRARGLIYPLLVERTPEGKRPFRLWGGFTRYEALKLIAKQDAEEVGKDAPLAPVLAACRVYTFSGSSDAEKREEALFLNLRENMLREDLSTYDIAERLAYIRATYGLKANEIRKQLLVDGMKDMSKGYINNLCRAYDALEPSLREVWGNPSHPANGLMTINAVQQLSTLEPPEQLALWETWTAVRAPGEGDSSGAGGDDGAAPSNGKSKGKGKVVRRASSRTLAEAMDAVKSSTASADVKKGASMALAFAMGTADSIPGIFDPKAKATKPAKGKGKTKGKAGKSAKAAKATGGARAQA